MLRVNTKPRKRNSARIAEKSAPAFLQWIRGRQCCAFGLDCSGKIEAAHVDYAGDKGTGTKVADRFVIPLCAAHHRRQHHIGWPAFEREAWGVREYALKAAIAFWQQWPGRFAWERKLAGDA